MVVVVDSGRDSTNVCFSKGLISQKRKFLKRTATGKTRALPQSHWNTMSMLF